MNFLILELTYLGLFVGMLAAWVWFRDRRPVKLPFTEDFRNQPGKSLLNELDDIKLDAFGLLITAFLLPFIVTAIFSQLGDLENRNSLVVVCGLVAWLAGVAEVRRPFIIETTDLKDISTAIVFSVADVRSRFDACDVIAAV